MTLYEAWTVWWGGAKLPDDSVLIGLKVLWLGRIGDIAQCLGDGRI
jgi:hypothetical protein